jgi:integrase/recombinase XerD
MNKEKIYKFNREIQSRLAGFKTYLQKLGNGENTIRQKQNYAGYFLKWLELEQLETEEIRYNELLNFIDYCKLEGNSKRHINSKLRSIRNFYEYLKETNSNITNPAINLYLKGTTLKLPSNIIDYHELEKLYHEYQTATNRDKRNKVILGLLIYQGLTTGELHQLKSENLKLKQGKIFIPGNLKRNSRTLELKPFQILELYEYVNKVKPQILKDIGIYNHPSPRLRKAMPARKPNKINNERLKEQLFISINGSENIKNSLLHMFRKIRKTNPEILHPKQIRSSVIVYWLKHFNLRQVQYFAGHKYVSSTERYQMNNLEGLKKSLEEFHPLK